MVASRFQVCLPAGLAGWQGLYVFSLAMQIWYVIEISSSIKTIIEQLARQIPWDKESQRT